MRLALMMAACATLSMMSTQLAFADACRDAFMKAKTVKMPPMATKSRIISQSKGQQPSTSQHLGNGAGDWMTLSVDQPQLPWALESNKVLYSSTDQGKTWKKVRDMNEPGHDPEVVRKQVADAAAAATNLTCGFEDIDGQRHETFEADFTYPEMKMTTREKLWIRPGSGRVVKSHMIMRGSGMEVATTQFIEYLPELTLPKP